MAEMNFDQVIRSISAKDLERFKARKEVTTSELSLCLCLFNLLVDVTVDSYPYGLVTTTKTQQKQPSYL